MLHPTHINSFPSTNLEDGVEHKLAEPSHVSIPASLVPLPLLGVVELVAPETLHQLRSLDLELVGVDLGKLLERESPAMEARAETHRALRGINLDVKSKKCFKVVQVGGQPRCGNWRK